jgi:hypothetical protein
MQASEHSATVQDCEFETNIIVLGYLAAVYGASSQKSPVRHWGQEYAHREIKINNDKVTASRVTRQVDGKPVLGVLMVIHRDSYNGGNMRIKRFFPFEELDRVLVTIRGVVEA